MSCYYCNIHSSNRQKRNWNFIINFPRIGKKRACYPLTYVTYVYIYRYLYNILPTYLHVSIFYIDKLVEKRQSQSSILISYGRGMNQEKIFIFINAKKIGLLYSREFECKRRCSHFFFSDQTKKRFKKIFLASAPHHLCNKSHSHTCSAKFSMN